MWRCSSLALYLVFAAVPGALFIRHAGIAATGDGNYGQVALLLAVFAAAAGHAIALSGIKRASAAVAAVGLWSWGAEYLGTTTGWLFGSYSYSAALGWAVGNVPLTVPAMWFAMTYSAWRGAQLTVAGVFTADVRNNGESAAAPARRTALIEIVVAALLMTAWDLAMDIDQVQAGRWTWPGGGSWSGIPLSNFAGWALVAAVAAALLHVILDKRLSCAVSLLARCLAPIMFFTIAGLAAIKIGAAGLILPASASLIPLTLAAWFAVRGGARLCRN